MIEKSDKTNSKLIDSDNRIKLAILYPLLKTLNKISEYQNAVGCITVIKEP